MKKISIRKAAAIRLTAPCQCHYSAFNFYSAPGSVRGHGRAHPLVVLISRSPA
jgi:hypothetical protein